MDVFQRVRYNGPFVEIHCRGRQSCSERARKRSRNRDMCFWHFLGGGGLGHVFGQGHFERPRELNTRADIPTREFFVFFVFLPEKVPLFRPKLP